MQTLGVSGSEIIGYAHNHPVNEYCRSRGPLGFDERRRNAYPSVNDWNAIDGLVPTEYRDNVTIYVLGCDSQMRAFPYAQRNQAERDREQGAAPPAPIAPEEC